MDELARWLGVQLDEDERIARAACEYAEAEWRLDEDGATVLWWPPEPRVAEKEREKGLPVVSDRWRGQAIESSGARIAPHVAEWDPARVLREINAKRQIVGEHDTAGWRIGDAPRDCQWTERPCRTLRLLALLYADRPGYREEWRP